MHTQLGKRLSYLNSTNTISLKHASFPGRFAKKETQIKWNWIEKWKKNF